MIGPLENGSRRACSYLSTCHGFGFVIAASWTTLYWEVVTDGGVVELFVMWYRLSTELTLDSGTESGIHTRIRARVTKN